MPYITRDNGKITAMADQEFPGSHPAERPVVVGWDGLLYFADAEPQKPQSVIDAERVVEIKVALDALDAKYLTLRVITNLATGDAYALEQKRLHEEGAAPLRAELETLTTPKA